MVVEGFIVHGHSGMDTVCSSCPNLSKVVLYISALEKVSVYKLKELLY